MAIKILQYTFDRVDNPNGVNPNIQPSSVQLTYEDSTVGKITTRTVYADTTPTRIWFGANPVLTLDYINVTEVQSLNGLFWSNKTIKSANISNQTAKNLIDIYGLFYQCNNVEKIDMSNLIIEKPITNSSNTFLGCGNLYELNLKGSRIDTDMYYTFAECASLTEIDTSAFITDRATTFRMCFYNCRNLKSIDISTWNTSNATNMETMFGNCSNLESIKFGSNFKTSSVTNMSSMFTQCSKLKSINTLMFDTSSATSMSNMFNGCISLKILNLSSFNTSNVTNCSGMFFALPSDVTVYRNSNTWTLTDTGGSPTFIDVNGKILGRYTFDNTVADCLPTLTGGTISSEDSVSGNITTRTIYLTSDTLPSQINFNGKSSLLTLDYLYINQNITTLRYSFISCTKLTNIDASYWDVSNVTDYTGLFESCTSLITANISNWKIKNGIGFRQLFYRCGNLKTVEATNLDLSGATDLTNFFNACGKLQTVIGIEDWDVSNIKYLGDTFAGTSLLEFDITNWNITSKLTNLSGTFASCNATIGDLSHWDTSNVTSFNYTFCACRNADLSFVENWNTDRAENMFGMFESCNQITELDLSNWNTSNVKNMAQMFRNCSSLHTLNVSNFNTSNVTNMSYMFQGCTLQTFNLLNFDTSKVTTMGYMFANCTATEIDISSFTTESLTSCSSLFRDGRVKKIDMSNFKYKDGMNFDNMFYWCNKLETIGTLFCDTNTVNKIVEVLRSNKTESEIVTVYYHDANEAELNPINNGTVFVKYEFPTTISLPSHINLYGLPNGTRDELDVKTGILTRNLGKFVLDGSFADSWRVAISNGNTVLERSLATGEPNLLTLMNNYGFPKTLNKDNSMTSIPISTALADTNNTSIKCPSLWMDSYFNNNIIRISIPNGVVNDLNENGYSYNDANKWLNENPITIVYKLSTPTTEKLILNYNHSCDYGMVLPKGAVDRYDVINSKYYQNISSVTFNGENTWHGIEEMNKCIKLIVEGVEGLNMKGLAGLYCDNDLFPNIDDESDIEHCRASESGAEFYFYVDKNRLSSPDLIGWQIWLQQNPFTMYYELAETKVLDKPYDELDPELARWEMMDSVKEGTISYTSNNNDNLTLYPNMTYVAPSVNNFDVEALEPNTTYTVYAENVGGSLNLGGNTSNFTSGTTFTSGENKWLTFNSSPDVENIMLIKGDTTDEVVPYFTGINSVVNPTIQSTSNTNNSTVTTNLTLRSSESGVKDSYNIITGEYIQRVDENLQALETPITTTLEPQELLAYENGQILLSSESGMLPTMIYSLPSSNAFRLPSMRTGTRYTLKYPSASGSIGIGEINYKITGPSMLFTTPLTIKGDTSSIVFTDDDPQDVMLIEGDYSKREIPFFTGMRSSENIVVTTTKDDSSRVVQTQTTLRALPNGAADKLDLVSGQLLRVTGIREYREGDLLNREVFTDQIKTIYPLSTPTVTTLNLSTPMGYAEGNVELSSDALIPTLRYRLPSSNNFILELLKPETRYTLYANYEQSGSFTLGGTLTQSIGNAKVITTSDTLTNSYLTFDGDLVLSNVMLIEGDSREFTVPYFNGLLSVENAIIRINGSATEVNRVVLPNTVKLRSLHSLMDELDLVTGVYTKRIESKTLTGDENWQLGSIDTNQYISFKLVCQDLKTATSTNLYCDRFNSFAWTTLTDQSFEFVTGDGMIEINIRKDRLTTANIAGFKRWLKQYPTTVHYELTQPSITTLTLPWTTKPISSFYGNTTIQTSVSQSLKPYLQVIVATTTLEEVVSDLKVKNAALEEENLSTMMAVTEVFEMIMYIMPSEATTINIAAPMTADTRTPKGGFQMVEVYVTLIIKGKKTLEQVPAIIRPQVEAQLIELGVIEA